MSKNILITGGGGMIGKNLIKHLLNDLRYENYYIVSADNTIILSSDISYINRSNFLIEIRRDFLQKVMKREFG